MLKPPIVNVTPPPPDEAGAASKEKKQSNSKSKPEPRPLKFDPEVVIDEVESRWKSFIQRVRIHELLKCMRSHHERLKVLRDHTDLDEMLDLKEKADEEQLKLQIESRTLRRRKKREREEALKKLRSRRASVIQNLDVLNEEEDEEQLEKERKRQEMEKKHDEIMGKGVENLFLRTQEEEEEAITQIYPPLKQILTDPKYVAKCAIAMFSSRSDITDDEFDSIIALCQDELEKQALRDAYEENKSREKYLHKADEKRRMLYEFINSTFFIQFMLIVIIVSIVGIFLITFESIQIHYAYPLVVLDNCIIGIFLAEATFKIAIYKEDYFKKPWNLLDILIIAVNFIEVSVELITKTLALSTDINSSIYFKVFKSLRALRLLRIIKFLPTLQVVVTTIFQSMLSMGSIAVLMLLFIFVFAVMGRGLFSEDSPKYFGRLGLAFVTLFQLLTLDDWFQLMQDLPKSKSQESAQYWIMFIYLFFYIIIENLVFLNLFVAVLVDNFQLTLAETEVRKHKESLIYSKDNDMFTEIFEELDRKLKEHAKQQEGAIGQDPGEHGDYIDPKQPEMTVPDYFPVGPDSRERLVLENIFKDFCGLDFQRFLLRRRVNIMHTIMDKGITSQRNTWSIQDNTNIAELSRLNREFTT